MKKKNLDKIHEKIKLKRKQKERKKSRRKVFIFPPFISWETGVNMKCQDITYGLYKYNHNKRKTGINNFHSNIIKL